MVECLEVEAPIVTLVAAVHSCKSVVVAECLALDLPNTSKVAVVDAERDFRDKM